MSTGSGIAGFIRDIILGLFAIGILIVIALVMNDGKLLEDVSPTEQTETSIETPASQQLIVFNSSTTLNDMLSTQKVLAALGIQLFFDEMKFAPNGNLESLTVRVENKMGKSEVFQSPDVSTEAVSFDAKLFVSQNQQ